MSHTKGGKSGGSSGYMAGIRRGDSGKAEREATYKNSSCYNYIKWIRFNYSPKRRKTPQKTTTTTTKKIYNDNDDHGVTAITTTGNNNYRNRKKTVLLLIFSNYLRPLNIRF